MARKGQILKKKEYRRSVGGSKIAAVGSVGARSTETAIHFSTTASGNDEEEEMNAGVNMEAEEEEDEEEEEEEYEQDERGRSRMSKKKVKTFQVLPVAEIGDDWEGEAEDGATYLALANRESAKLPFTTRVENPFRTATTSPEPQAVNLNLQAGPSRHPALPSETWRILFPIHFVNYRKRIQDNWPPSPRLPYPPDHPSVPTHENRHEWLGYINGFSRRRIPKPKPSDTDGSNADVTMDADGNGNDEWDEEAEAVHVEDEEEAFFNSAPQPVQKQEVHEWVIEPETARHRPREPMVSILQHLNTAQIISIFIRITNYLNNFLDTIPDDFTDLNHHALSNDNQPHPNPFSEHFSKWVFSLLLILDPQLMAQDVSYLRDLARSIMRIGGWRWISGVTSREITKEWELGNKWKEAFRSDLPLAQGQNTENGNGNVVGRGAETDVDETLSRCWVTIYAIAVGWGQHDLIEDLENLFK